ncbi:MAG TPA: hypothetical protein VFE61_18740, partial [Candidatus Sulfotelmatobacter sp.]|nr:hypothetical protein [Candidatus Sulfotelmatobacter sp.]
FESHSLRQIFKDLRFCPAIVTCRSAQRHVVFPLAAAISICYHTCQHTFIVLGMSVTCRSISSIGVQVGSDAGFLIATGPHIANDGDLTLRFQPGGSSGLKVVSVGCIQMRYNCVGLQRFRWKKADCPTV